MRTVSNVQTNAPAFPLIALELLKASPRSTVVAVFLGQAALWRRRARHWLTTAEALTPLTPDLAEFLRAALGEKDAYGPDFEVKRVFLYPEVPPEWRPGNQKSVHHYALSILLWRSMMIDYLSDVWDVIGPPLFDLPECSFAIGALLMPEERPGEKLCYDCLQRDEEDRNSKVRHYDDCVIRILRNRRYGIPEWPE